ncbi:MAG: HAD family hydrolase [Thermoleophilaceae bacterium]
MKAVLLDSFGTLLRMDAPGPHLRRELAGLGVDLSVEEAAAAFRAEISYYLAHNLEGRDAESLLDLRNRCAGVVREAIGRPDLDLDSVREAMLRSIRFSAFEDAPPALAELRASGIRTVVASNWDCSLPEALERAGLRSLVDGVAASAVVGAAKPARELFLAALELAGAEPGDAVHVGDSFQKDVEGARAAGLSAVLLARDGSAPSAREVPVIRSLAELPALLT